MKKNSNKILYFHKHFYFALVYIVCFLISTCIGFGSCYAYFTAKAEKTMQLTAGTLNINYVNNSSLETDSLILYNSRLGSVELTSSSEVLPGDTIQIRGNVKNLGNIKAYCLLKTEVGIVNPETSAVESSETLWYTLEGVMVVDSNSDGKFDTEATTIDKTNSKNVNVNYLVNPNYDNSYSGKMINITLTICSCQYDAIDLENGYTNVAIFVTNKLING